MTSHDRIPTPVIMAAATIFFGCVAYKLSGSNTVEDVPVSANCRIKGDVSLRTGKRVFYVPGQRDYLRVGIDKNNGDRWFCSETEAMAAGWTKSPR